MGHRPREEAADLFGASGARTSAGQMAIILGAAFLLALLVYWPCLDNGFISDDFVILERVDHWQWALAPFGPAHETFRLTSYGIFWLMKHLVGFNPAGFYLFSIALHAVNASLLFLLLIRLRFSRTQSALAGLLFLTAQNAQEAVMWLAAVNELLLAFFALVCLHLWTRGRFRAASVALLLALFSKESGLVVALAIPCFEFWQAGRVRWHRRYVLLLAPVGLFALVYAITLPQNALLTGGDYALRLFHPIGVLLLSIHRLFFPWLYLLAVAAILLRKPVARTLAFTGVGLTLVMAPYLFLSYMGHLPSRQVYLATMILSVAFAELLTVLPSRPLAAGFIVLFVIFNTGYIHLRKDGQFEDRAAPTARLLEYMQTHKPQSLDLKGFPYNPWVAKLTTRLCPGWFPALVHAGDDPRPCPHCIVLRWNPTTQSYLNR